MSSNHLILCCPLLFLPSIFPSIRVFPMSWLFESCGPSIGASASATVLPMNIQSLFPLGLTGMTSLLSKGLSRVFSNTTVQKHQFFSTKLSLWPNSHIHTWLSEKTIALTRWTFVGEVMSLLFNTVSWFVIAVLPRSKHLQFHGCSHRPQSLSLFPFFPHLNWTYKHALGAELLCMQGTYCTIPSATATTLIQATLISYLDYQNHLSMGPLASILVSYMTATPRLILSFSFAQTSIGFPLHWG